MPCAPDTPISPDARRGAEKRVRDFIADHEAWWTKWGRGEPNDEGTQAAEELRRRHFADGNDDTLTSWSSHPPHTVAREALGEVRRDPEGRVVVETSFKRNPTMPVRTHYEYVLVRDGKSWRIAFLDQFVHDRSERARDGEPGTEADIAERYLDPATYFTAIFQEGRVLKPGSRPEKVRVRDLGMLEVPSGRLGAADPHGTSFGFQPLKRRVPPGRYLVQTTGDDTAAMRVLFRPDVPAASYRLARPGMGVDVGTAAVFDAEAMMALTARDRDRLASDLFRREQHAGVTPLRCGGPAAMAFSPSGMGDGHYPVIWALGADGEPVALIVDFLLYAKNRDYEVTRPVDTLKMGPLVDPGLKKHGKTVTIGRVGRDLTVTHDRDLRVRLTRGGQLVAGSMQMQSLSDRTKTTLKDAYGKTPPVDVTVSVFLGFELAEP